MTTNHVEDFLVGYLRGELEPSLVIEVNLHLVGCSACRDTLAWLTQEDAAWDLVPSYDPGVGFTDRVMAAVDDLAQNGEQKPHKPADQRMPVWKRPEIRHAAAAVIASFILWHGVSGVVFAAGDLNSSAYSFTDVVNTKVNTWAAEFSQWLKR